MINDWNYARNFDGLILVTYICGDYSRRQHVITLITWWVSGSIIGTDEKALQFSLIYWYRKNQNYAWDFWWIDFDHLYFKPVLWLINQPPIYRIYDCHVEQLNCILIVTLMIETVHFLSNITAVINCYAQSFNDYRGNCW